MIGKVPRPGRGFRGLVSYLLHGAGRGSASAGRVAWTASRNLLVDDPDRAPALMRMTAAKSVRVARPVYHFVISWRHDEGASLDVMRRVADATCRDLGLDEHQRLYIAHRDTRNPHVHVVVNRVHPETGIAWQTSHDYRRIEQSLARQARELGLDVVPGRHNGARHDPHLARRAKDGAYSQARREGGKLPRGRLAKDEINRFKIILRPVFEDARSWAELEDGLGRHGLALARKGQGLVIANDVADMKLSDLGAGIRLQELERRFGRGWREADRSPTPGAEPAPPISRRRRTDRDR